MIIEITFHYPPELFELLIQTIPLLCRSKKSVITFFQGAGVNSEILSQLYRIVENDKDSINKFEMTRQILADLNKRGEVTLRERREILKRVTEFEDYSTCWPDDQLKAKGLVSEVRRIVDVKDTFTKMKQELDKEKHKHQEEHKKRLDDIISKQKELEAIKEELFSLFTCSDAKKRGKLLESVLNKLFTAYGISIREAFELVGENNEGIIEQIDGVIEIDGYLYLVEMKWWKEPLGKSDIAPHLVKIFNRGHAGGIYISNSGYTEPAIIDCKEALSQKIIVLCELEEIVMLLERRANLKEFIKTKINIAVMEKKPFSKIL